MTSKILKGLLISAFVTVSATNAMASDTPAITVAAIEKYAPDANVSALNHRQISTLMNVISSGDEGFGEKQSQVRALIRNFENGVFSG
jgi:hypothetical protein